MFVSSNNEQNKEDSLWHHVLAELFGATFTLPLESSLTTLLRELYCQRPSQKQLQRI